MGNHTVCKRKRTLGRYLSKLYPSKNGSVALGARLYNFRYLSIYYDIKVGAEEDMFKVGSRSCGTRAGRDLLKVWCTLSFSDA